MPVEIPDLWADDIKVDVLPPLVILKAQDEAIRRKTQGILCTEVSTVEGYEDAYDEDEHERDKDEGGETEGEEGKPALILTHTLELVAPALAYRESLLEVSHTHQRAYPATLRVPEAIRWDLDQEPDRPAKQLIPDVAHMLQSSVSVTAYSAEELIRYLRRALQSRNTKAAIDSLLARSNETRLKQDK